jgi:hypothetical protein
MNNRPVSINELDINKVTFVPGPSKPGRNPAINIKYDGQNLQLRVPRLNFPGGVMVRTDEKTGATSYTLMGTLKDCDPYASDYSTATTDLAKFYNFLLDLEKNIKTAAVENSAKWFGKKRSQEAIDDGFNRIVGTSKDNIDGEWVPNGKYPPSFKCKVPVYDNKVSTEIVDGKRDPVYATPEALTSIFSKGVEANLVVSGSIYVIAGGGFGVTWRLQKAQVFQRARVTAADVFESEDVEEGVGTPDGVESSPAPRVTARYVPEHERPEVELPESAAAGRPATPELASPQLAVPSAPQRKRRTVA